MAVYGVILLNLAIGLVVLLLALMVFYFCKGDYCLFLSSQQTALGISFLTLLVTVMLMSNLLKGNFNIDYVAKYTSQGTPVLYKLTALWAGQSGSLLFWLFILSIYPTIVIFQNRFRHHE